jgi:hypothetical protein
MNLVEPLNSTLRDSAETAALLPCDSVMRTAAHRHVATRQDRLIRVPVGSKFRLIARLLGPLKSDGRIVVSFAFVMPTVALWTIKSFSAC